MFLFRFELALETPLAFGREVLFYFLLFIFRSTSEK